MGCTTICKPWEIRIYNERYISSFKGVVRIYIIYITNRDIISCDKLINYVLNKCLLELRKRGPDVKKEVNKSLITSLQNAHSENVYFQTISIPNVWMNEWMTVYTLFTQFMWTYREGAKCVSTLYQNVEQWAKTVHYF